MGPAVCAGVGLGPDVGLGVGFGVGFEVSLGVATGRGTLIVRGFGVPGRRAATSLRTWVTRAAVMNEG